MNELQFLLNGLNGSFYVNGKEIVRVFTCQDVSEHEESTFSIGEKCGDSDSFKAAISTLEFYVVDKTHGGDGSVLDALKNLIISCQLLRNQNEEPLIKKKTYRVHCK